eukprot:1197403-Rhodomonas_salina.2
MKSVLSGNFSGINESASQDPDMDLSRRNAYKTPGLRVRGPKAGSLVRCLVEACAHCISALMHATSL